MKKINYQEMLVKLCKVYPGFRNYFVESADLWVSLEGKFLWGILVGSLSRMLFKNIEEGDYSNVQELFVCLDELIEHGDEEVATLITTQLLEGMLNSRTMDQSLWRPLLGEHAASYCNAIDAHYAKTT